MAVIILAIVGGLVVVVGILAVLGIYGMRKYIANSKTAEARNALGQIGKDAAVAYEKESLSATVISPGSEIGAAHMLCESASESVPSSAEMIRGRKYQSTPSEWDVDRARHAGFSCLKFSMDSPQYYMYSYKASGDGTHAGDSFTATANGDLNGDGVLSTFTLEGRIVGSGASATLQITPSITEVDPQE